MDGRGRRHQRRRRVHGLIPLHVLVGASSVGLTQHVGVLRGMIESRLHLGEWHKRLMQNPARIMEAYLSCTQELSYQPGP